MSPEFPAFREPIAPRRLQVPVEAMQLRARSSHLAVSFPERTASPSLAGSLAPTIALVGWARPAASPAVSTAALADHSAPDPALAGMTCLVKVIRREDGAGPRPAAGRPDFSVAPRMADHGAVRLQADHGAHLQADLCGHRPEDLDVDRPLEGPSAGWQERPADWRPMLAEAHCAAGSPLAGVGSVVAVARPGVQVAAASVVAVARPGVQVAAASAAAVARLGVQVAAAASVAVAARPADQEATASAAETASAQLEEADRRADLAGAALPGPSVAGVAASAAAFSVPASFFLLRSGAVSERTRAPPQAHRLRSSSPPKPDRVVPLASACCRRAWPRLFLRCSRHDVPRLAKHKSAHGRNVSKFCRFLHRRVRTVWKLIRVKTLQPSLHPSRRTGHCSKRRNSRLP